MFKDLAGDEGIRGFCRVGIPLFEAEKTMETLMMLVPHLFQERGKEREHNSNNQKSKIKYH